MADPAGLRQVLVNLVGNALKFTPAGGRIALEIESAEADVVFCVRDTGPGIEEADQERIFVPYEQIESIAHGRGIGLGLPLSRRLARLMDGDLWVESSPGKRRDVQAPTPWPSKGNRQLNPVPESRVRIPNPESRIPKCRDSPDTDWFMRLTDKSERLS